MEYGGHSPDSMVFYLPKIKLIFAADETYYFFPIWPDSDTSKQKKVIEKIIRMNDSGEAELFVDGHHHNVVAGNGIKVMLTELLEYHKVFQDELLAIIKNSPKKIPNIRAINIFCLISGPEGRSGIFAGSSTVTFV